MMTSNWLRGTWHHVLTTEWHREFEINSFASASLNCIRSIQRLKFLKDIIRFHVKNK